jgi:hypothetical protein
MNAQKAQALQSVCPQLCPEGKRPNYFLYGVIALGALVLLVGLRRG